MYTSHPTTELLKRNAHLLHAPLLLVNPPELATVNTIVDHIPKQKLYILTTDWAIHSICQDMGLHSVYNTTWDFEEKFKQALVCLPKSDEEILLTLTFIASKASKTSEIGLIGQNNAGIKSARKTLESVIGPVTFTDNARHSAFYLASPTLNKPNFNLVNWWKSFTLPVEKGHPSLTFSTLPGVFSHGKLDDGSALLLESLFSIPPIKTPHENLKLLDWGCGSGVLGLVLSHAFPQASITLADSSSLAIASARHNLKQNSISNCQVVPTHLFSDLAYKYNFIVANPPFHKGRDTHYEDTENFLKQASLHLTSRSTLRIVANNFLRYEQYLEQNFNAVRLISSNNKYKVLEATSPISSR